MQCHNITLGGPLDGGPTAWMCAPPHDQMLGTLIRREMRRDTYGLLRHMRTPSQEAPSQGETYSLDIGGHVGTTAIFLAMVNPLMRVVTVEPSPENVRFLIHNVRMHGLQSRIHVEHASASDWDGNRTFEHSPDDTTSSHAVVFGSTFGRMPKVFFESRHLNFTREWRRWRPIDFLKVDCEGCELDLVPMLEEVRREEKKAVLIGEFHEWHLRTQGARVLKQSIDSARRSMCAFPVRHVQGLICPKRSRMIGSDMRVTTRRFGSRG